MRYKTSSEILISAIVSDSWQTIKQRVKTEWREKTMASLKVPASVPPPYEDAEQLNKAFKGLPFIILL
jgi:hypothetical protein